MSVKTTTLDKNATIIAINNDSPEIKVPVVDKSN